MLQGWRLFLVLFVAMLWFLISFSFPPRLSKNQDNSKNQASR